MYGPLFYEKENIFGTFLIFKYVGEQKLTNLRSKYFCNKLHGNGRKVTMKVKRYTLYTSECTRATIDNIFCSIKASFRLNAHAMKLHTQAFDAMCLIFYLKHVKY